MSVLILLILIGCIYFGGVLFRFFKDLRKPKKEIEYKFELLP